MRDGDRILFAERQRGCKILNYCNSMKMICGWWGQTSKEDCAFIVRLIRFVATA